MYYLSKIMPNLSVLRRFCKKKGIDDIINCINTYVHLWQGRYILIQCTPLTKICTPQVIFCTPLKVSAHPYKL